MRALVDRLGNRGGELWAETSDSFFRVLPHPISVACKAATLRYDHCSLLLILCFE
jgi:hypothetical protein